MRIKKISFATMKPFHLYMSTDKTKMYKVSKTIKDKNIYVNEFVLNEESQPLYSLYNTHKLHKVSEDNLTLNVIDLGTKPIYTFKNNKLVFTDLDKAFEKFDRFISNML